MWRSKLGTNYRKDFMELNEALLRKELHTIRDLPENSICADCGVRGTIWASVNLGVFLCMTCGAHHRSLGTHISLPKGCTDWWGPDEIHQMKAKGNAHAKVEFGDARPPNGVVKEDALRWKQFLTDKYVHKKYAQQLKSPGGTRNPSSLGAAIGQSGDSPAMLLTPTKTSPRFLQKSALFSHNKPMPDLPMMHFETSPVTSPKSIVSPQVPMPSPTAKGNGVKPVVSGTGDDFFAQFGV